MWHVNSFHIQILLIELLFCWHLPRRSHFWLRLLLGGGLYVGSLYLIPGGYFSPFLRIGWFTFGFLAMLLLSAALLRLCFDILPKQLVFYCCVAHTLQHIVHCLGRVLTFSLSISARSVTGQAALFVILLIVMWLGYYLFLKQTKGSETADIKNTALLLFAVASSLIIYVLSYWTTSRETDTIGVELFDAFSCILLLGILLDTFRYSRAERENLVMMHVLRQEQAQHEMSRATVEVINRKCHDLKHQISALRSMDNPEEKERSIRDLEQSVMIYDRFVKSGNRDLDIILAEKNLLCEEKGIELHGILDGEKLSFIKTEDLYSLMGNALTAPIKQSRLLYVNRLTVHPERTADVFRDLRILRPDVTILHDAPGPLPEEFQNDSKILSFSVAALLSLAEESAAEQNVSRKTVSGKNSFVRMRFPT